MIKKTKKTLIAAIILFFSGVITIGITFAAAGFDYRKFNNMPVFEEKNLTYDITDINSINIETFNQHIELKSTEESVLKANYFENEETFYSFTNSDGIYKIKLTDNQKWYQNIFNFNFDVITLTIEIPATFSGDINIINSNSKITVSNLNINNLTLTDNNNQITLSNLTARNITATTDNDKILAENLNVSESAVFTSANGKIIVNNSSLNGLDCKTSNSEISLAEIVSNDIKLYSSNGDISGTIIGTMSEYKIISSTSNGTNNLPSNKTDGIKNLNVRTSNKDIYIIFIN
jgi:hypothetical protein